jgi:DNA-binding response OmpR family regulator
MKIAILDDEKTQLQLIEQALTGGDDHEVWGEPVDCHMFDSGLKLLECLKNKEEFDCILLDRHLPDMSGDVILQWLRQYGEIYTPVLMLTSLRAEEQVVESLAAGADDYVTKPFRPRELVARVQRLVRKTKSANERKADSASSISPDDLLDLKAAQRDSMEPVTLVGYYFEPLALKVTFDGKSVSLTEREFRVALLLFSNLNAVLPRDVLFKTVWKRLDVRGSRALDTHIYRVRTKLELTPKRGFVLRSVYGYGYRLDSFEVND